MAIIVSIFSMCRFFMDCSCLFCHRYKWYLKDILLCKFLGLFCKQVNAYTSSILVSSSLAHSLVQEVSGGKSLLPVCILLPSSSLASKESFWRLWTLRSKVHNLPHWRGYRPHCQDYCQRNGRHGQCIQSKPERKRKQKVSRPDLFWDFNAID